MSDIFAKRSKRVEESARDDYYRRRKNEQYSPWHSRLSNAELRRRADRIEAHRRRVEREMIALGCLPADWYERPDVENPCDAELARRQEARRKASENAAILGSDPNGKDLSGQAGKVKASDSEHLGDDQEGERNAA